MRAVLFAAFALAACASPTGDPTPTPLPQHIQMDLDQRAAALRAEGVVAAGIGETADLGNGLRVRPLEVLEDSRCPQNARCVWAGRLRLRVIVNGVGEREIILDEAPVETLVCAGRGEPRPLDRLAGRRQASLPLRLPAQLT